MVVPILAVVLALEFQVITSPVAGNTAVAVAVASGLV